MCGILVVEGKTQVSDHCSSIVTYSNYETKQTLVKLTMEKLIIRLN